ncbi:MAG: hypothetical protein Kow00104_11370 [Rhodothalassiaceae bacterium]
MRPPSAPPAAGSAPAGGGRLSASLLLQLQETREEQGPLDEAQDANAPAKPPDRLGSEEQAILEDLRARDAEVRAHEAAHARAGGEFAGPPQFTFETGPDGRLYAVAGEVSIDTAPVPGDAAATIEKLETVIRAALAPAEPSSQDLAVAAQARARLAEARAEAARERREAAQGDVAGAADRVVGALADLIA